MRSLLCALAFAVLAWLMAGDVALAQRMTATQGPLARYVAAADESYSFYKVDEGELQGGRYVELIVTSQTWRDTVWKHQLFILKPAKTDHAAQAMLLIGGGRWNEELAQPRQEGEKKLPNELRVLATAAEQIQAPVAILLQVPQQPIFGGMVEDEAISYTFEQFLKTGDETWPLLLPMVKSAVRAMDTVQTVARDEWKLEVQGFTLTGASKRGWTTWLTGAVDARATAIAPMVIDVLNMDDQMRHQLASWGKFSEEIQDYTDRDIQSQNESEQGKILRAIVDPYAYRAVLTQPKLILLGTNDRYWPLDALNLYWSDLPDEKHVLYVPNNGHGLKDLARVMGSTVALHKRATGRLKLPELAWSLEEAPEHLHLSVTSDVAPDKVSAWIATAPTRDFRDAKWTSLSTTARDKGYEHKLARPEAGFAAMFGEAVYSDGGLPYFLSTNVRIISSETTAGGR